MLMEMVVICFDICSEPINTLCRERAEVWSVELDGTYNNYSILKGYCSVGTSCSYIVCTSYCTQLI
jgi:hypothetical protein